MSHRESLDNALDHLDTGCGRVSVGGDSSEAVVDVVDVDRLGVRVRGVNVTRPGRKIDVAKEAQRLSDGLRSLSERVAPSEIAPSLGGAILRSTPEEMNRSHRPGRPREFFEVNVGADGNTAVKRVRVDAEGERGEGDWTMTRESLGRLLDDLDPEA